MKHILTLLVTAIMLLGFQNCGGAPTAEPGDAPKATSLNNKFLGLYDFSELSTIHYSVSGGMMLGRPAEVTVRFSAGATYSVTTTIYKADSSVDCLLTTYAGLPLPEDDLYLRASGGLTLSHAPINTTAIISDCQYASLAITLTDSSEHTYLFQTACLIDGQLSIVDPNNAFAALVNLNTSQTCPVN